MGEGGGREGQDSLETEAGGARLGDASLKIRLLAGGLGGLAADLERQEARPHRGPRRVRASRGGAALGRFRLQV